MSTKSYMALLLSLLCVPAFAAEPTVTLRLLRVVDGDTFVGDVVIDADKGDSLPWNIEADVRPVRVTLKKARIRLLGCDAWEMRDPGGPAAKSAVEALLAGDRLTLDPEGGKRDSFGRLLATVYADEGGKRVNVAEWIIENKHGRRWVR